MGKKPKIIRDKLKDKIIDDIWRHFWYWNGKQGKKKEEVKWKNN